MYEILGLFGFFLICDIFVVRGILKLGRDVVVSLILEEMLRKVWYYLKYESEREKIRWNGWLVIVCYNYIVCVRFMLLILRKKGVLR